MAPALPLAAPRYSHRLAVPVAMLVSLAAHGVVLGLAMRAWQQAGPAPSVGRTQGAVQVVMVRRETAEPVKSATTTPERVSAAAAPRKQRPRSPKPSAEPRPAPATAQAPSPPPPPDATPGARFASLFAPVVHAPIGHGSWTSRRPSVPMPVPDAQAQRAQSLMALRTALQSRLADTPSQADCALAVDVEHRVADLACADTQTQTLVWGRLQGLLAAGPVERGSDALCLQLSGTRIGEADCMPPFTP
jgi:hypothetical protein